MDIVEMIKSTGLSRESIFVVDPIDQKAMKEAIEKALEIRGTAVIVAKSPCALLKEVVRARGTLHCEIDADKCRGCKACMRIACPAMAFEGKKARIADPASCTGCGLCMQQCKFDAIRKVV
jgi:indolepyruvate ferredoxin oxidoreductase alpha subunit